MERETGLEPATSSLGSRHPQGRCLHSRHSSFAALLDNFGTVLAQRFTQAIDSIHSKSLVLLPDTQVRDLSGGNLVISLVGAGRFERPTPCAQGRCATRLRYAPTLSGFLLNHIGFRAIQGD